MSITGRLTAAASVALAILLGLTGAALDRAFRDAGLASVRDRLESRVYALLAAAEIGPTGRLRLTEPLPDTRLTTPAAGVYAQVRSDRGDVIWRSPSIVGVGVHFPEAQAAGVPRFAEVGTDAGPRVFALEYTVRWQIESGEDTRYRFEVAETRDAFEAELAGFRRGLWSWFAAAAVVILLVQVAIVRWGLAPLRRLARAVADVEAGRRERLPDPRPDELGPLVANMNGLIATGRRLLERHRNALADLAHSLKTPLAVLRGALTADTPEAELRAVLDEQLERIDRTVDYQLRRAASGGGTLLARPVAIASLAGRLRESLLKVHAERALSIELDAAPECAYRADEGDLMEILGNLLDNACKWAAKRVRVRAWNEGGGEGEGADDLVLEVEDDGPGIAPDQRERVLARGARADSGPGGHGIGLAVVRELVREAYGGEIGIDAGPLGGARVRVRLPGGGPGGASVVDGRAQR